MFRHSMNKLGRSGPYTLTLIFFVVEDFEKTTIDDVFFYFFFSYNMCIVMIILRVHILCFVVLCE